MSERRVAHRYDLSLPVVLRTGPARDDLKQGETRDISTRGIYFLIDQDLSAGSEIDLTLTLPSELTHGSQVLIRATGKVVRVDPPRAGAGDSLMGVAAIMERYDITRAEKATA